MPKKGKGKGKKAEDETRPKPQLKAQSSGSSETTKSQPQHTVEGGERAAGQTSATSSIKHEEEALFKLPRKDCGDGPKIHEQPRLTEISKAIKIPEKTVSDKSDCTENTPEAIAEQVSKKDIVAQMTGLTFKEKSFKPKSAMAKRPGKGKLGKEIALIVNYFKLDFKDISIYHYDVDICEVDKFKNVGKSLMSEGMTAKQAIAKKVEHVEHQQKRSIGKRRCREIISQMLLKPEFRGYSPVYDGQKNIYTCKPFPIEGKEKNIVNLTIEGREKTYCVILQPVNKGGGKNQISFEPLKEMYAGRSCEVPEDVLMALETIMGHRNPPLTQVQVRSSYFPLKQPLKVDLGSGLEVWFGYNQSVHFTQRGPVVVINLAAKAFHKAGSVIDYASEVLRCDIRKVPKLQNYQINKLEETLTKIRVEVTHQQHHRRYCIKGVTKLPAKDIYQVIENKKISVADYFTKKYKKLQYPHLPCLAMRTTNSTYIPFENCVIYEGQPKVSKLEDPFLTARMIKQTAIPPERRFNSIAKDAQSVSNISKQAMLSFGLFMDVKLMEINGRVLTSPGLAYDSPEQARAARPDIRGVWKMDGKKFYKPVTIKNWILLSFAQIPMKDLENFATCLSRSGSKLGLKLGPFEIKISNQDKTWDALEYAKRKADLAVVILSNKDRKKHRYKEVKFVADFQLNLITQCIDDGTLSRVNPNNDQITSNVCLKLNQKLGGINHILFQKPLIFRDPCIVFGADAIHWPRGYGYPSIAAVVGSLDPFLSRYALTCRVQENLDDKKISQEIIREMKDFVKEIFQAFCDRNKRRPMRIIFFRDGVSDGQFSMALEKEVSSIQMAAMEVFDLSTPIPLTYIVVQKNHQTRFRPKYISQGVGKMGNIPPGTVVDSDVVHPVYYDYFLCSHEGIQGTSKPAHYTVIHDDNYLSADELQQLTYHLCHMYGRCNRSVSMPAPVIYADLACTRAKSYADLFINNEESSSTSSGFTQRKLPDNVLSAINSMKSFPNNLFYI